MIKKRLHPSYDIVVSLKKYLWPKAILKPIGNHTLCFIIHVSDTLEITLEVLLSVFTNN